MYMLWQKYKKQRYNSHESKNAWAKYNSVYVQKMFDKRTSY